MLKCIQRIQSEINIPEWIYKRSSPNLLLAMGLVHTRTHARTHARMQKLIRIIFEIYDFKI